MNFEMTGGSAAQRVEPRLRAREWIALGLLLIGPFLLVIGWFAGVVMLWTSNRWSTIWKIAGTAAWPVGWAAAAGADWFSAPLWLSILIATIIEIAVYVALIKEARV